MASKKSYGKVSKRASIDFGSGTTTSEKSKKKQTKKVKSSLNKISTLAGHLRGKYNSTYSKDDLTAELKEIYAIYEKGHFDEADTCSATA